VVGPLGRDAGEPESLDEVGQVVVINQFGVAEHLGAHAEHVGHPGGMGRHLVAELLAAVQERQAVVGGLGQQFHLAGVHERAERIDDLRRPPLELLQRHPRDGVRDGEVLAVPAHEIQHQPVRRQVTA